MVYEAAVWQQSPYLARKGLTHTLTHTGNERYGHSGSGWFLTFGISLEKGQNLLHRNGKYRF